MAYKDIGVSMDRQFRDDLNQNFKDIDRDIKSVEKNVSEKAFAQIVDSAKLNWKEPVDSLNKLPAKAAEGDTRMTRDTGKVWRFDGTVWREIQEVDVGPVNEVDRRLTSELAEKANELETNLRYEQTDYVELLKRHNNFGQMQLYKINDNQFEISVFDADRHITFQFMFNNDDYMVQTRVWTGGFAKGFTPYKEVRFSKTEIVGSGWVIGGSESVASYTNKIGDKFTYDFTSEDRDILVIYQRLHPTGGRWKYTLDTGETKTVSVFSTESKNEDIVLFRDIKKGSRKLTGEYLGGDPNNPLDNPRGWTQEERQPFIKLAKESIVASKDITLTEPSNKEFAFYIKPEGGTKFQFVPFHGDPTSVFASQPIIRDGSNVINLSELGYYETILLDSFSLDQHIYGRHPDSGNKNILEIWTTSMINKQNGMLSFDGKMKVLEPVTFNNSYVIMGTARGDNFERVVTSFRNQYIADSSTYGANIKMEEERDWAKSFLFLSKYNKNIAIAYRYNNIKETLRQGEDGKDQKPSDMTYLQNRSETLKKIYSRLFDSKEVEPGYRLRFSGDYIFCNGSDLFNLMSL